MKIQFERRKERRKWKETREKGRKKRDGRDGEKHPAKINFCVRSCYVYSDFTQSAKHTIPWSKIHCSCVCTVRERQSMISELLTL